MDAENWRKARELFDALADLAPDAWATGLDELGVSDAVLREEVLSLLKADRDQGVRTGLSGQAPDMLADLAESSRIGAQPNWGRV